MASPDSIGDWDALDSSTELWLPPMPHFVVAWLLDASIDGKTTAVVFALVPSACSTGFSWGLRACAGNDPPPVGRHCRPCTCRCSSSRGIEARCGSLDPRSTPKIDPLVPLREKIRVAHL